MSTLKYYNSETEKWEYLPIVVKANGVNSINEKQGDVVINTDDVLDTSTNRYTNDSDISRLENTSGINTGDQDLSDLATEESVNTRFALKLNISDVVNDLVTPETKKALSAAQGKILKDTIDTINQIITSDDTSLNELQEIVDYIKANREELEALSIGAIAGLQDALNTKATTAALNAHTGNTSNPHSVTKAQVGLGNVDNTSDADKPISTATKSYVDAKANASDTVNLTGNQTVAGVKTFSSSPIVPTATTGTQAVNKAQMDTADALKVNKAGDIMTGVLSVQLAADPSIQITNTTIAKSFKVVLGSSNFGIWNVTDGKTPFKVRISAPEAALEVLDNGVNIGGVQYLKGTGFPEGVVTANVGSIYIDTAITNGASSWIKKSGTGNTGWKVLEGDTGWRDIRELLNVDWRMPATTVTRFLKIRRINNIVYIQGSVSWQVETPLSPGTTRLSLFTIPSGFQAPQAYFVPGTAWRNTTGVVGRVGTGQGGSQEYDAVFGGYTGIGSWGLEDTLSFQSTYATLAAWPITLPGVSA